MKKYSVLFSLFILPVIFYNGCEKRNTKDDGLQKKDILVQMPWIVDELYHSIGGKNSFYERGGMNTTGVDYDRLRFVFKADGTGNTTQQNGDVYQFDWKLSPDERSLSLKVYFSSPLVYSWKLLEITNGYLHATAPLIIHGDPNNLESFRLIQSNNY